MDPKSTEQLGEEFWLRLSAGDPALADLFHPDITLRPSGDSPWSGTFAGADVVVTYLIEVMTHFPLQSADLVDMMISEQRVAYLLDLRIERSGREVRDRSIWLIEVRDGLVVDWELNDSDQYAMDAFWCSFPESASG